MSSCRSRTGPQQRRTRSLVAGGGGRAAAGRAAPRGTGRGRGRLVVPRRLAGPRGAPLRPDGRGCSVRPCPAVASPAGSAGAEAGGRSAPGEVTAVAPAPVRVRRRAPSGRRARHGRHTHGTVHGTTSWTCHRCPEPPATRHPCREFALSDYVRLRLSGCRVPGDRRRRRPRGPVVARRHPRVHEDPGEQEQHALVDRRVAGTRRPARRRSRRRPGRRGRQSRSSRPGPDAVAPGRGQEVDLRGRRQQVGDGRREGGDQDEDLEDAVRSRPCS